MSMKTISARTIAPSVALTIAVFLGGCGMDFEPASSLSNLRVLAIQATPLEAGPGESITLAPVVYLPADQTIADQTWTFCPFGLGPQAGYGCAVPECEQSFVPEADGSLTSEPLALGLECAARFVDQELPEGIPLELPEKIEMTYTYRVTASDGTERESIARVPVYPAGAPAQRNQAPLITQVEIGDQAVEPGDLLAPITAEDEVVLRVLTDPASLDAYRDESGRDQVEEAIVSYYATAGRFDFDRSFGTDVEVVWKAKELLDGQTQADVYVVVRDLRGGQAVAGPFYIPILR